MEHGPAPTSASGVPRGAASGRLADHVVLIVWDGLDAGYRHRAETPTMDALARQGVVTTSTGVMQSVTNPSMVSLATGAYPERHLNAAYVHDEATGTVRGQTRASAVQTLGQSLVARGLTVASVQWFVLHGRGTVYGDPRALYLQPGGDCGTRVDEAVQLLTGRPVRSGGGAVRVPRVPDLTVVYCDDLDRLGHLVGPDHRRITRRLTQMDGHLGRLLQALDEVGATERTAVLLVGDHGMTSFSRSCGRDLLAAVAGTGHRAAFVRPGRMPAPGTDVVVVLGGNASLHLRGSAAEPREVGRLRSAVAELPQVAAVLGVEEQRGLRMSPAMGQLVVEPRPGWTLAPRAWITPAGRHGSTTELSTTLLMAGAGVLPGAEPRDPRHVDVAPTISALLGVPPPAGAQGRVLDEALARRASPRRFL